MAGLLLLLAALIWLIICISITIFLSKWIQKTWRKTLFIVLVIPTLLVGPFVNQIIGKFQFDTYCGAAEDVTFVGTIPAPKDLYSSEGEWRLGNYRALQGDENTKLVQLADSLVRWDSESYEIISSFTHVGKRPTRLYEKNSNSLVAEWTSYSYHGGLSGLMGSTDECHPKLMREAGYGIYKRIFEFQK